MPADIANISLVQGDNDLNNKYVKLYGSIAKNGVVMIKTKSKHDREQDHKIVFTQVEQPASFKQGNAAWLKFLGGNINITSIEVNKAP